MFTLCKNFYKWVKKRRERNVTIIVLGLDNAGKSTLLFGLKNELPLDDIIPTMGFASSKLVSGKYTIQYFDVGGAKNFRNVWKNYYAEVHGIIYVVDAAAPERLEESKETLAKALECEGIPGKPVLVFANKQDLPGCHTAAEISEKLGLVNFKGNRYNVAACQAKPNEGQSVDDRIGKSLRWLLDSIDSDYQSLSQRVTRDMEEAKRKEKERKEEQRKRAEASKAARLKEQAEREAQEKAGQAAEPAAGVGLEGEPKAPAQRPLSPPAPGKAVSNRIAPDNENGPPAAAAAPAGDIVEASAGVSPAVWAPAGGTAGAAP